MSDDITDFALYKTNLSEAISAINEVPVPTGFAIIFATSAADFVLSAIFAGTTVLFSTQ